MADVEVVAGLQHSEPYPVPATAMISRDANNIPLPEPVEAPAPEAPVAMDLPAALDWLAELVHAGVLHGSDHLRGLAALATVQPFLLRLRRSLDRIRADEDFVIGCAKDAEPHAVAFHAQHEGP